MLLIKAMKAFRIQTAILILFASISIHRCDHGIAPMAEVATEPGGISGTITYLHWPDLSTIKNLKVVVFKKFPPGDILQEVVNGDAIVHPPELNQSLPRGEGVDSTFYSMEIPGGVYEYVVVAQQFGTIYDWRAVGQYDISPQDSLPTAIQVLSGQILTNIDIRVDFDNLPVQPF